MMSNTEACPNSVFESTGVDSVITSILDNYNDVCSSIFSRIDADFAFATDDICTVILDIYNRIFIALIINISSYDFACYLSNTAIFLNNRNGDIVPFISIAFSWIKFKTQVIIGVNHSQFSSSISSAVSSKCFYSYKCTEQRFIISSVELRIEGQGIGSTINASIFIDYGFTVSTKEYLIGFNLQAIFVNVFSSYSYFLTESYLIIKNNLSASAVILRNHVKFEILNSAKFSNIESSFSIISTSKCYTNNIFTRIEVITIVPINIS